MSYFRIPSGSNLVLNVLLGDGSMSKYPVAYVYRDNFTQIVGSPFTLTAVSEGLYSNLSVSVSDGRYIVVYVVYDDYAHTQTSVRYSRSMDVFDVNDIVDLNAISQAVWRETVAGNTPGGSFGELVAGIGADADLVPAAKANTDTLVARLTATRAANLDNLNAPISALPSAAQNADAVWDEARAGHTGAGTFGSYLDTTVSSRESEANAAARAAADIAEHDTTQAGVAAVGGNVISIKAKTDQLAFTSGQVHSRVVTNADKTDYSLTTAQEDTLVDKVWDEPLATHLSSGTTGEALDQAASTSDLPAIADAIWDEARVGHTTGGTFGEALQGVLSVARAGNLDNLDAAVSTRESEAAAAARAATDVTEHNTTQGLLGAVQTILGTPAGASVSADIASVKSDTTKIGTPPTGTIGGALAAMDADLTVIENKIDGIESDIGYTGVGTVYSDLQTIKGTASSIKTKTDQLTFSGANVNADVQVNSDKDGYELTTSNVTSIADAVWDEGTAGHSGVGSFGKMVQDIAAGAVPTAIADAVWDELRAGHVAPGTFGEIIPVIDQTTKDTLEEVTDASHGLDKIKQEVVNQAAAIIAEVNASETKIDAIVPAIAASELAVLGAVSGVQGDVGLLSAQLTTVEGNLAADVTQVETKVDGVQTSVNALSNNTSVRFIVPERLIKPSAGNKTYQFHLRLYDDLGNPEAPDSVPTIRIRRLDTGVDIVVGANMTQDGVKVGAYFYNYVVSAASFDAPLLVEATIVEQGVSRYVPAVTEITEFESDLTAVQAQIAAVDTKVVTVDTKVSSGVYGLAALKASQDNIVTEVNNNEAKIDALAASVAALPTSTASSAEVAGVLAAVNQRPTTAQVTGITNLARDAVMGPDGRNVTQVYDKIDLTGLVQSSDPRLANLDAPVSSRSTLTAAQVWAAASRTLTSTSGLDAASIKAIWDYLTSQATTAGSIGKLLVDNINATISSRAQTSDVLGALGGVAQEATLLGVETSLTNEINANELLLNSIILQLNAIQPKVNLLPGDPASQSAVLAAIATVASSLANVDLRTALIKTKTDNLPADPAREATLVARPTNPLLTTDSRLNALANLDVAVSSVVAPDISNLATKADLNATHIDLADKIDNDYAVGLDTKLLAQQIKAKTDTIPVLPATTTDVNNARDVVISRIDLMDTAPTPAQIWAYPTREITQDPATFGPDISGLAEKTDLATLAPKQYVNKISAVFNGATGKLQIIAWPEKDGQKVTGSNCTITVKDSLGATVFTDTLATPTADGVFRFEQTFTSAASQNYYVVTAITVDSAVRTTTQSFFTVVS